VKRLHNVNVDVTRTAVNGYHFGQKRLKQFETTPGLSQSPIRLLEGVEWISTRSGPHQRSNNIFGLTNR